MHRKRLATMINTPVVSQRPYAIFLFLGQPHGTRRKPMVLLRAYFERGI